MRPPPHLHVPPVAAALAVALLFFLCAQGCHSGSSGTEAAGSTSTSGATSSGATTGSSTSGSSGGGSTTGSATTSSSGAGGGGGSTTGSATTSSGGGGASSSSSASSSSGATTVPCGVVTGAGTGAIFDLGHTTGIQVLQEANGRLLSQDGDAAWVLWDIATKALVARGAGVGVGAVGIAGGVFVVAVSGAAELRDAAGDGHVIASLPMPAGSTVGVATDGSYAWVLSPTDVQVWSPAGVLLFSHPGSYANSSVFAAPGQLRIGGGSNQIEDVDAVTGTSTMGPTFAGTFNAWFTDGGQFFSVTGNTVRIYTKDAVQTAITTLPSISGLTGQGNYFWTFSHQFGTTVAIYSVASPATPALTLTEGPDAWAFPGGNLIGVFPYGSSTVTLVHLDPGGITTENVATPSAYLQAFGADAAGNWSVGTSCGVVYDKANLAAGKGPLSCGQAFAMDGAASGLAVVGTDGGGVLTFQAGPSGFAFQGAVPYKGSRVQVSADGSLLAVQFDGEAQYVPDMSLRVVALPSGTTINTWPLMWTPSGPLYQSISLARGGTRIGQVTVTPEFPGYVYHRLVTDLTGSTTTFMDMGNTGAPFVLSPDGTLAAGVDTTQLNTQIFKNGTLVDACPGIPTGWLDNDRLVVQLIMGTPTPPNNPDYLGTAIHTVSTATSGPAAQLPCTQAGFWVVDASHVFCEQHPSSMQPWTNAIYDLGTDTAVWTGSMNDTGLGVVASSYAVFANGSTIVAEAYSIP